jgi:hypothetical protein
LAVWASLIERQVSSGTRNRRTELTPDAEALHQFGMPFLRDVSDLRAAVVQQADHRAKWAPAGIAVIGTIAAALAIQTTARDLVAPLIALPLLIPVLIAAARATVP